MLEVVTPAPGRALISLAEVKARLGVSGDTQDAALGFVIGDASAAIEGFLGRDLAAQGYRETFEGTNRTLLLASRWPIETSSLVVTVDEAELDDVSLRDGSVLFRTLGWPIRSEAEYISADYFAGYLLPDQVATWTASVAVGLGAWIRRPTASVLRYEVTTAGTLGSTAPIWASETGESVPSGTAVLTARQVSELPDHLRALAYREVWTRYAALSKDPSFKLSSIEVEGVRETYFAGSSAATALDSVVLAGLEMWRAPR
jgi:hypothetical protein